MNSENTPKPIVKLKIIEKKNLWILLSSCVILVGFLLMAFKGLQQKPYLNFGIDFIGGTTMILKLDEMEKEITASPDNEAAIHDSYTLKIRSALKDKQLEKSTIQFTQDNEVIIKTLELTSDKNLDIRNHLKTEIGEFQVLEIDFIGPTIGNELRRTSIWIIIIVSISLLIYISWRFEYFFGIAALFALLHDALITISMASLFNIEINTAFVAALLTILGYSINDTIVVFDRVRENLNKFKKHYTLPFISNLSISQTIARTINTSITTLAVIFCLRIFGGTTIKTFCVVLLIGVIAGTYSSVFIAAPLLTIFQKKTDT